MSNVYTAELVCYDFAGFSKRLVNANLSREKLIEWCVSNYPNFEIVYKFQESNSMLIKEWINE